MAMTITMVIANDVLYPHRVRIMAVEVYGPLIKPKVSVDYSCKPLRSEGIR